MNEPLKATENKTEENPAVIRAEMEETRSALAEKLDTLEDKVRSTVEAAQQTVQNTVETAQHTVQVVKRQFDLRYQFEQRPWLMMGASVATGFALGALLKSPRRRRRESTSDGLPAASYGQPFTSAPAPKRPSWVSQLRQKFAPEVEQMESALIGAGMGLVRDWLKDSVPSLAAQFESVLDSATDKMGGTPVHGRVLTGDHRRQGNHVGSGR